MKPFQFPWPPKELNPNARVHWSKRSKAAKAYRLQCYMIARSHIAKYGGVGLGSEDLHLWLDFFPPDRRRRDDDNMIASFKNGRDGLAEALGLDDYRFRTHPFVKDEIGGYIEARITTMPNT